MQIAGDALPRHHAVGILRGDGEASRDDAVGHGHRVGVALVDALHPRYGSAAVRLGHRTLLEHERQSTDSLDGPQRLGIDVGDGEGGALARRDGYVGIDGAVEPAAPSPPVR